jgi:hypothetical protein
MRLTGTCVLVLTVFACAVPAYAGNGNGNGNGNVGAGDAAPGNSASAPGQVKKEEAAAGADDHVVADRDARGVEPAGRRGCEALE